VVFCFASCQKLPNQERALSAPCSPAGARAGRRNATDRLDPPLGRSPSLFAITDSSDRQALMLFRCLGGSCTGEADRCKAKQSRREEGADVWVLTSNVVRFSDLVQSKKSNVGNHGGALFSSISRKKVTADVAGRRSISSSIRRDRRAGITETDLAGLLSAFKDSGHPCQRSTSRSSRLSGLRTGTHHETEGALLKSAWMRDEANRLLWWRGCGVRPVCLNV
jgi:hypothetical protein